MGHRTQGDQERQQEDRQRIPKTPSQGRNQQGGRGQEGKEPEPLKVIFTNAHNLLSEIDNLYVLVTNEKPHIVLINETWLNNDIDNSLINIPGYFIDNELRVDRTHTRNGIGGGLIVYVRNDVKVKPDPTKNSFYQYCSFQVFF